MTFWRTFHAVNEDIFCSLGLSLNLMLLVVIMKVKVKSMQKYNILLSQCCCVDLIQVIISLIVKPVTILHHKNLYYLSNGLLRDIGGQIEMLGIVLWITSVFFCICTTPVSFVFRYRTLCLNAEISKKFYITSLLVALLGAASFAMIVWKFQYLENQDYIHLVENNFPWIKADDGKVKIVSVGLAGTYGMLIAIINAFIVVIIPYIIIIVCNIKITKYLKHHQYALSAASRRVQTDLNRTLMAQAIIPVFSAFFPMGFHILNAIVDLDFPFATFICGIMYSWIPVGNAISVLVFVTAYREKLKQLCFHVKLKLPKVKVFVSTTNTQL